MNDCAAWLMFSYLLAILTYQFYMHRIPRFLFCNILRWQISIKSLSIFELLTYLPLLSEQIRLRDKDFPIIYLLDCFLKSTTTWVAETEMVPI